MTKCENLARCPECKKDGQAFGVGGGLQVFNGDDGRVWIRCDNCGYEWTQHTVGIPGRTPAGRRPDGAPPGAIALGT
jgi:hypothetical protein